jgi:putative colanic acid biosynthesis glycosyltransferase
MTVVSVSKWLNDQVKLSFFNKYPNKVIYNGIDVNIFSPSNNTLSIRNIHKVENKFLILGVAGVWSKKKGLLDFIMLSNKLDENFQIILIGLNKDQLKDLPKNIIGIPLTENLSELSDYYSAADVYVNLSVEETFGLTTAEALSCGTPAIVYNSTACPELVDSETGIIVEKNNINDLVLAIEQVREKGKSSYASSCRKRALNIFDKNERFLEYINLFEDLVKT